MEIEEEKPSLPPQKFQFENGDIIVIPGDVLEKLETLASMISDFPQEDRDLVISLENWIEKRFLQWIVDAYVILIAEELDVLRSLDLLYRHSDSYSRLTQLLGLDRKNLLALFGDDAATTSNKPTSNDLHLLYQVAILLNWLGDDILLKPTLKIIYEFIDAKTTAELEVEYTLKMMRNQKRGIGGERKKEEPHLPYTPLYKREKLIRDFLALSMPYDLIHANRAFNKYVNPITAEGREYIIVMKPDDFYDYARPSRTGNKIGQITGKPLMLASGSNHSIVLTEDGLFGHGNNTYNQLFLGDLLESTAVDQWIAIPRVNLPPGEILLLSAGNGYTIVLTTEGLFGIGQNNHGQLASRSSNMIRRFIEIKTNGIVRGIHCGYDSVFVLTTTGLYAFGNNTGEKLSVGTKSRFMEKILPVVGLEGTLLSISSGTLHVMFVTTSGLYASGISDNYQIPFQPYVAIGMPAKNITEEVIGKPISVHCGPRYTFLLTTEGLYATGNNTMGQLGIGNTRETKLFTEVTGYEGEVQSLTCLDRSAILFTTKGVYQTGENLGLPLANERDNALLFTSFKKLALDMGYFPDTISIDLTGDEEEEEGVVVVPRKKKIKLRCTYCKGRARFMSSIKDLPYCSKVCLLQSP